MKDRTSHQLSSCNKNFALLEARAPPGRLWRIDVVNITDDDYSERRTSFITVDNTSGETTVVFSLQQLWSDANSNRRPAANRDLFDDCDF